MSAVLLVSKDKKQVAKVTVADSPFIMGRSPQCQLPLDEELASRQHAEIVMERGAYWIRDRGSRNGTFVNGEKINASRELKDGDEIGIGSTRIKFFGDKKGGDEAVDEDATRAAASVNLEKKNPGQQVVEKKSKGDFDVKLRVAEGPLQGGVFRNWEGPLTIGRSLKNHVVLVDDAVSSVHAQIVQEGEQYFIVDLKSSNGTFLEGIKVQKEPLSNGQKIKIGVSTLVFELTDLRKQRRNLKIALISTVSVVVIAALIKLLQPPDIAGQHISLAANYEMNGDLSNAVGEFDLALKVEPSREEAKRGYARVQAEIEARETLKQAEASAAAENYDKAKELVYRVLRDFPQNSRALELAAVIESIENAKIAFTARNWTDAQQLLEKAQEAYPKSELINLRLQQAQKELNAQQNLSQANVDLQHQQLDLAEPLLQSIPTDSVYFVEAKEALDGISASRWVADCLGKAQSFYRDGQISEALGAVDAGLQRSPGNSTLAGFQGKIRQMEALVKPLAAAEAMAAPNNLEALLRDKKACDDVIALEADPLNSLRKRAQAAQAQIAARLQELAQATATQAAATLQAGDRKAALNLYELAVKADPDNQDISDARDSLHKQVVSDCRALYEKGVVHQDLGQEDLARAAFQQVLAIGIPGEKYYEQAARKLKEATQ
jgi:pSer/pThr/pTyr-binding forkhead associated (FHA) protein